MPDLSSPAQVLAGLEKIERDLAQRQVTLESAATDWFKAKREREHDRAVQFLGAVGTVAERNAIADRETAMNDSEKEALWEALKAVVRVLETRASILQSVLRAQGRA